MKSYLDKPSDHPSLPMNRRSTTPRQDREMDHAIAIADKILNRPYADPDDDEAVLARQFLRAIERHPPKHMHVRDQEDLGSDRCTVCGFDLRHEVHHP
jgi:hypothetical protein